jgi:hypothetical protein
MPLCHGTLLSGKVGQSDQHFRLEMGKSRIEFVRRANKIKRRANGDGRNREKTDRCFRPIGQEKKSEQCGVMRSHLHTTSQTGFPS